MRRAQDLVVEWCLYWVPGALLAVAFFIIYEAVGLAMVWAWPGVFQPDTSTASQEIKINRQPTVEMIELDGSTGQVYQCPVSLIGTARLYVVAYYLHETPPKLRYIYQTESRVWSEVVAVGVGNIEGYPVAFEWWAEPDGVVTKTMELVKTCGTVPDPAFPLIFADGFESGTPAAWDRVVGFRPPPASPASLMEVL